MKLVAFQTNPRLLNIEANLNALLELIRSQEFDLAVAPELALTGYLFESRQQALEFAIAPEESKEFAAIAEALSTKGKPAYLVLGFAERAKDDRLYNSAALLGPQGLIGVYRKVHLFDRELELFDKGDLGFLVFDLPEFDARLGMMVCFDWLFPEAARSLALAGADIIAHPSNLVLPYCQRAMPIRALENRVFAITANRIGTERLGKVSLTFTGRSIIVSPKADLLAEAPPDKEAVISAEIDVSMARNKMITERNHVFADRRTDQYRI